jgi:DNA-binding GntR family transcriptional regulator
MARSATAPTRTDELRNTLRKAILRSRYAPGDRLPIAELAAEHGVSTAVVREALTRLVARGLVVSEPNRGFRVRPLDPAEIDTIVELRVQIESMVLSRSIEHGDLAWEAALVAAQHRLVAAERRVASGVVAIEEWLDAHEAFHAALAGGAGSGVLGDIRAQLYDASELYRSHAVLVGPRRDPTAEHAAIVDAALARDADLACRLLADHLRATASGSH